MKSNIKFESNVYPLVEKDISSDRVFLSKIWDYNRLYSLNQRNYGSIPWDRMQRRILEEQPICALNKEDPCWGMVKKGDRYCWASMCTKEDCELFSRCRSVIPYDAEAEMEFVPRPMEFDEYGYKAFINRYHAYPASIDSTASYEEERITKVTKLDEEVAPSIFKDLLRQEQAAEEEHLEVIECDGVESSGVDKEFNDPSSVDVVASEPDDISGTLDAESIGNLHSPDLNVFEYFTECNQDRIIGASEKESFFVDAGPGTGKTYTLIQKINHLVTEKHVDADGILVLCFTNAAVDEVKERLKAFVRNGADRSLNNVDVRTFHSFAWWLINQANSVLVDDGWKPVSLQTLTYRSSLDFARKIVSQYGKDVVGNWEYFFVDEVQDLTNSLGYFVLSLVDACIKVGCGVTVLGDACQAIYDYEQEDGRNDLKSKTFYQALFRKMVGKAKFVFLTENHRQGEKMEELTLGLRSAIISADCNHMKQAVEEFISKVEQSEVTAASINESYLNDLRGNGTVCLLFRNNGQTLKMSSDLRKRGVSHYLNISEVRNNYSTWISDVFFSYDKPSISEEVFLELYRQNTEKDGTDVWRRLQKLLHSENDVLSVRDLLNAIAVSKIDDALLRTVRTKNAIVSNIHRSKGREYDCVIIDKSFVDSFSDGTMDEDEYKTLYVAMTRPKRRLMTAALQTKNGIRLINIYSTDRKRWGMGRNNKVVYFEFDSAKDLSCEAFLRAQKVDFSHISAGDEILLKRRLIGETVEYDIIHADTETVLGKIEEDSNYVKDLMGYMRIGKTNLIDMPSVISDIYVSGLYSQVVSDNYLEQHPQVKLVAPNGVWKWVDLVGIGHASYDVY